MIICDNHESIKGIFKFDMRRLKLNETNLTINLLKILNEIQMKYYNPFYISTYCIKIFLNMSFSTKEVKTVGKVDNYSKHIYLNTRKC